MRSKIRAKYGKIPTYIMAWIASNIVTLLSGAFRHKRVALEPCICDIVLWEWVIYHKGAKMDKVFILLSGMEIGGMVKVEGVFASKDYAEKVRDHRQDEDPWTNYEVEEHTVVYHQ